MKKPGLIVAKTLTLARLLVASTCRRNSDADMSEVVSVGDPGVVDDRWLPCHRDHRSTGFVLGIGGGSSQSDIFNDQIF